jgi:hypothetical protein
MRRFVRPGLFLLLAGCQSPGGNPADSRGNFIGDTHTFQLNPNRPLVNSLNMQRIVGQPGEAEPLGMEPGNVWPSTDIQQPTLQDLQREQNQIERTTPPARGTTVPTPPAQRTEPAPMNITPPPPAPNLSPPSPPRQGFLPGGGVTNQGGNGVQTSPTRRGGPASSCRTATAPAR